MSKISSLPVIRSIIVLATFVCTAFVSIAGSPLTHASAPGNLAAPFDIGSTWNICQGYNNSKITHHGADSLALDFTGSNCDNSASGRIVRSPANGTIYSYGSAAGSLCINTNDGRSIALIHINSTVTAGQLIGASQTVGSVASPGTRANGGIAHVHLQMWSMPNCYNSNTIPFSSTYNARICGAPDFPVNGPDNYNNGTWSGTTVTADSCSSVLPTNASSVYRFFSPITKRHLYTADQNEANTLRRTMSSAWKLEGEAYYVDKLTGCGPSRSVHRFYSQTLKTHLYTIDENEKNTIIANFAPQVWGYEGVAFCADSTSIAGTKPAYRFYSQQLKSHLYTTDENEKNTIVANFPLEVWSYEGIAYYVH